MTRMFGMLLLLCSVLFFCGEIHAFPEDACLGVSEGCEKDVNYDPNCYVAHYLHVDTFNGDCDPIDHETCTDEYLFWFYLPDPDGDCDDCTIKVRLNNGVAKTITWWPYTAWYEEVLWPDCEKHYGETQNWHYEVDTYDVWFEEPPDCDLFPGVEHEHNVTAKCKECAKEA